MKLYDLSGLTEQELAILQNTVNKHTYAGALASLIVSIQKKMQLAILLARDYEPDTPYLGAADEQAEEEREDGE